MSAPELFRNYSKLCGAITLFFRMGVFLVFGGDSSRLEGHPPHPKKEG